MAELGNLAGAFIGPIQYQIGNLISNAPTTQTFNGINAGWCARIIARDTRDIKSVGVNFSAATSPGTITLRIETIDGTTGKPSSGLYDPSATKQFTPTGGWNLVTFDTLPTGGLIPGNMYGIVLLKDNTGTTCTLRSHTNGNSYGNYPTMALQASSGVTGALDRNNFAEVTNSPTPIAYFILEDDTYSDLGCVPSVGGGSVQLNNNNTAVAQKITLPVAMTVRGVKFQTNNGFTKGGTPTGDLRMRILDESNNVISGTTVVLDKDAITQIHARAPYFPFSPVTLSAGTYRVAIDSAGDASNNYAISYINPVDPSFQSSGFCYSQSTDMTTSFTWTDNPIRMLSFGLELDSIPAQSGGTSTTANVIDPLTHTIPGV